MFVLKLFQGLNCLFVLSVALSAAARILPIFRKSRSAMLNLFVLGLSGVLTSILFRQFVMVCVSLTVSLHELYVLEMYQRDVSLRKMKRHMAHIKKRVDRLERRLSEGGDRDA